jgi:hypothetical protein
MRDISFELKKSNKSGNDSLRRRIFPRRQYDDFPLTFPSEAEEWYSRHYF